MLRLARLYLLWEGLPLSEQLDLILTLTGFQFAAGISPARGTATRAGPFAVVGLGGLGSAGIVAPVVCFEQ